MALANRAAAEGTEASIAPPTFRMEGLVTASLTDSVGLADAREAIAAEVKADADARLQAVSEELLSRLGGAANNLRDELEDKLEDSCGACPLGLVFSALGAIAGILRGGLDARDPSVRNRRRLLHNLKYQDHSELLLTQCKSWAHLLTPFALMKNGQIAPSHLATDTPTTWICTACSGFVMLNCVLVTLWCFPGYTLFQTANECGDADGLAMPAAAMSTWSIRHRLFWVLMFLISIAFVKVGMMCRDNVDATLCGILLWKLDALYNGPRTGPRPDGQHGIAGKPKVLVDGLRKLSAVFFFVCIAFILFGSAVSCFHFIQNSYGGTKNVYYLVHAGLMVVLLCFLSTACSCCLLFLISLSKLSKAVIESYSELVEMTCLFLNFKGEKFRQEFLSGTCSLGHPMSVDEYVYRSVAADPSCQAMLKKMAELREFLIEIKNSIQVTVLPAVNFIYGVVAAACIVAVFWLYVIFLESRTFAVDKCGGTMTTAVTVTAGVVVIVFIVTQPLLTMAAEAHTWEQRVVKPLNSPTQKTVSAMISPTYNRKMLFEEHAELQDVMTWKILGLPMLPSSIITAVSAYLLVIWTTVVWPAIGDYVDELQAKVLSDL